MQKKSELFLRDVIVLSKVGRRNKKTGTNGNKAKRKHVKMYEVCFSEVQNGLYLILLMATGI